MNCSDDQLKEIYIVFTIHNYNYDAKVVGVFDSWGLAKIEQQKNPNYNYIEQFTLNEPS